ncbi:hypothetical protein Q7P35_007894 [Cladosporium inversicolor]
MHEVGLSKRLAVHSTGTRVASFAGTAQHNTAQRYLLCHTAFGQERALASERGTVFQNLHAVVGYTARQLQNMYLPIGGAIGTAVDSSLLRHRAAIADRSQQRASGLAVNVASESGAIVQVLPHSHGVCQRCTQSLAIVQTGVISGISSVTSANPPANHAEMQCSAGLDCMPGWSVHVDRRVRQRGTVPHPPTLPQTAAG